MTTQPATIGDMMARYAELRDRRDDLDAEHASVSSEMNDIENAVSRRMKDDGVEKTAAAGFSLSLRQKWRAKYEPDKWAGIVKWAVETGNDHIVQRRLTDAKVMELIDNGVALPDGLGVEAFTGLDVRRVK